MAVVVVVGAGVVVVVVVVVGATVVITGCSEAGTAEGCTSWLAAVLASVGIAVVVVVVVVVIGASVVMGALDVRTGGFGFGGRGTPGGGFVLLYCILPA